MSRPYGRRSRGGGSRVQQEPATALHDQAVKLYDKGDGHGADWTNAAIDSFRIAFYFLQNLPADSPDRYTIARRVHDLSYALMADVEDSGAAWRAESAQPPKRRFTMADPAPEPGPRR